ncbi:MAG: hypothetical protein IT376_19790 [Polyangiaceae bacterium]|nr:hypothetical protein [Polyangiaceae bacterium]
MTARHGVGVLLAVLCAGVAAAAPAPGRPPGAPPAASGSAAASGSVAATAPRPATTASTAPSGSSAPGAGAGDEDDEDEGPDIPPPPEYRDPPSAPLPQPRAGTQSPSTVVESRPTEVAERAVVGADVGVVARAAAGGSATYAAGPSAGGFVRFDPWDWLGARLAVDWSRHDVDLSGWSSGLGAGTALTSPPLEALRMRVRLEPTWRPAPRLRLWVGVGAAWTRLVAPEPATTGALLVRSSERTGVSTDLDVAVGGAFAVVPRWLLLELAVGGALPLTQSGTAFEGRLQGIDQQGRLQHLAPLPRLESAIEARLGVGLVL